MDFGPSEATVIVAASASARSRFNFKPVERFYPARRYFEGRFGRPKHLLR
jgi:hypothetical protein